jgi:hypothetical protein
MVEFAEKVKLAAYMTREEYDLVKARAKKAGMHTGAYVYKLATIDNRYNIIRAFDEGARVVRARKKK